MAKVFLPKLKQSLGLSLMERQFGDTAQTLILLADSSKFNRRGRLKYVPLNRWVICYSKAQINPLSLIAIDCFSIHKKIPNSIVSGLMHAQPETRNLKPFLHPLTRPP